MSNVVVQYYDRDQKKHVTVTPDTPLPTSSGGGGGGSQDVNVQNWPDSQKVEVTNPPKTVGVGNILTGSVDPNSADDYPKLIEPSGATAIEIQCPQGNSTPLLVSNSQMPFGAWEVYPGTSKVFYYDTLYISLPDGTADAQNVTFMAVSQQ